MDEPEYLICISCETPCYTFEWEHDRVTEVMCAICGADEPEDFATEEEFDAMASDV